MGDRIRAVPAWASLCLIVGASFVFRAWLAHGMAGPFIMVDELIYSELAKSFADGLSFSVRGVSTSGYGAVYPVLIAPAYALFDRVPDAYAAIKTINSLVMSLAGVPAYFIARRVVGKALALTAALLAVTVPSMVYTAVVMTENAFYPVLLLATLALVALLERPTPARYVGFFAAFGLAYLTRSQAVVIALAAATAPFLLAAWTPGRFRATLRPYVWLYAVFAGSAALGVGAQVTRGRPLNSLLGAYAVVGQAGYDAGRVLHFIVYHVAELDLYVGVIPFAVAIVLTVRARSLDRPLKVVLAVTLSLVAWSAVVVGTFASRFADRIQERNMFAVTPLLLILLLAWIELGAPRPRAVSIGAAVTATVLILAIPFDRFLTTSALSDTLALLPWWAFQINTGAGHTALLVLFGAAAFALTFLLVPRRYALLLPVVVLVYWAVMLRPIWFGPYPYGFKQAGLGALFQGIQGVPRDWIDRAVPRGADVVVLWTGGSDRMTVNQNEFFNRSVGQVYYTADPTPGGIGEIPVAVGRRTGIVRTADGRPIRPAYILTNGSVDPNAVAVARDPNLGMTVWKVSGPVVLARTVKTGLYPDTWSGPRVTWTREHCSGGSLTASLSGDAQLFPNGNVVTSSSGRSVHVAPNKLTLLRVPLVVSRGACSVAFTIAPTAVPRKVIPGNTDSRVLGAHFNAFAYMP